MDLFCLSFNEVADLTPCLCLRQQLVPEPHSWTLTLHFFSPSVPHVSEYHVVLVNLRKQKSNQVIGSQVLYLLFSAIIYDLKL